MDRPAQVPWAPEPSDERERALAQEQIEGWKQLRRGRVLCEDGFCLGVLRLASAGAPYRTAVPEAICPVCGRRSPISW